MRRRGRRWVRLAVVGAIWAGLLGAVGIVGPALWARSSASGRVFEAERLGEVSAAPVALVLGAGVSSDGRPSPFLQARLDLAAELYRRGLAKVLLVSGDNSTHDYDEPSVMRDYLVAAGIPAGHIVPDFAGRDTYDSCARAKRVFGVDRLLLVSQSYHLPRALAICQALGLDAVGVGDDSMARYESVWRNGRLREYPANVKAVWDVASRRDPILGPPEPGVRDALARPD